MEKLQVLSFKNKAIVSMLSAKEQNPRFVNTFEL